jgi:endonuclease/exonuclease/phosphatase family metal-dependent hydrolase
MALLGLEKSARTDEPGVVLIQIDGLSKRRLERAMEEGRMPFLKSLVDEEGHRLRAMYSGMPSTTPAAQGELFYGVRTAVPGFGFFESSTGSPVRMLEQPAAIRRQEWLEEHGAERLLEGGSAYGNIYDGGAEEAHVCVSTLGRWAVRGAFSWWQKGALFLLYLPSFLRAVWAFLFELALTLVDAFRAGFRNRSLPEEMGALPARVGSCVVMRETTAIGCSIDAERGLPIVQANLIGYDKQAHHRGPDSRVARWTLQGVDRAIKRIARAAEASEVRHYQLWVYSDHGQEAVEPFEVAAGERISLAVRRVAEGLGLPERLPESPASDASRGTRRGGEGEAEADRALIEEDTLVKVALPSEQDPDASWTDGLRVVQSGPVAHVYLSERLDDETMRRFACGIVEDGGAPIAVIETSEGVRAFFPGGEADALGEPRAWLGAEHPYAEAVARDVKELVEHPDAGAVVLFGWRPGRESLSFATEQGAHGGPGAEETTAFLLAPSDAEVTLPTPEEGPFRLAHLREAVLNVRAGHRRPRVRVASRARSSVEAAPPPPLRLMTWNVHGCVGMDGRLSMSRVARTIGQFEPDVVALQELDVGRDRSEWIDQAAWLAESLHMESVFAHSYDDGVGKYGNAILATRPMEMVRHEALPDLPGRDLEPRSALWARVDWHGVDLQVMTTHLGLNRSERLAQIDALLGERLLGSGAFRDPAIFCGDLNAPGGSEACRRIATRLHDARLSPNAVPPLRTWTSRWPMRHLDHVFASASVHVERLEAPRTALTRLASDHLPLVADLRLSLAAARRGSGSDTGTAGADSGAAAAAAEETG